MLEIINEQNLQMKYGGSCAISQSSSSPLVSDLCRQFVAISSNFFSIGKSKQLELPNICFVYKRPLTVLVASQFLCFVFMLFAADKILSAAALECGRHRTAGTNLSSEGKACVPST